MDIFPWIAVGVVVAGAWAILRGRTYFRHEIGRAKRIVRANHEGP